LIESLRFDGIYTPPSLQGSIMYPGPGGGSNWGGVAIDPVRGIAVANVMDLPFAVRLFPADEYEREREANPGVEISPQQGTPFGMARETLVSSIEIPCSTPPQGTISAVDLATGEVKWQVPLGVTLHIGPLQVPMPIGAPTFGGPLITASGIIFIGGFDNNLRAIDIETTEELWAGLLPASGQATPMTYRLRENGRQFVVIAAGGHARAGTMLGDSIVAFALPETRAVTPLESVRETLLYLGLALVVAFLLTRFGKYFFSKWLWFPLLVAFVIIATETGWLMTQSIVDMALSFGLALAVAFFLTRLRKYFLSKPPIET
jgi:quinoprotein glucose dehydrogenase